MNQQSSCSVSVNVRERDCLCMCLCHKHFLISIQNLEAKESLHTALLTLHLFSILVHMCSQIIEVDASNLFSLH